MSFVYQSLLLSCADCTYLLDSLTPSVPIILAGPPIFIQCPHRADLSEF